MKRNLSVFLDFLRFIAALAVVLGHSRTVVIHWLPVLLSEANIAVAIFFVLSGFVIRFVSVSKEADWKSYAVARIVRIYPVAILTTGVTVLVDHIGQMRNPAYYASLHFFNVNTSLREVVSYLTFTNEIWIRHAVVGSAEPYWSLSFEVWYYVVLAILMYTPARIRIIAVAAWICLVGPKILVYLPLWLLGAICFDAISRRSRNAQTEKRTGIRSLGAGVSILLFTRLFLAKRTTGMWIFENTYVVLKSFVFYMCIGIGVVLVIAGFDMATRDRQIWTPRVEAVIRWLAGGSFTLYLIHLPLLVFFASLFPSAQHSKAGGVLVVATVLVASYLCAELAERRKRTLRAALNKLGQLGARLRPARAVGVR